MTALDAGLEGTGPGKSTLEVAPRIRAVSASEERCLALVVIWWRGEPERVGEVLMPGAGPAWFGRGEGQAEPRLELIRQRPGENQPAPRVEDPFLSRRHLRLTALKDSLAIECSGKQPLVVSQGRQRAVEVRASETLEISGVCAFVCVERPRLLPSGDSLHEFGGEDSAGFVGESAAAWQLRQRVRFVAGRSAHVLVTGASGTGKELVAHAIHRRSARAKRSLVARNAATLPPSLVDAELFGNAANYPNAGMAERPGLIGQADGSTLFLDEIGELPSELHAHLLRVLDAGEYHRLGESRSRASDFRFVAATNRDAASLKPDLAARLALTIHVPGLHQRREDIPLLARHIVRKITKADPELERRYMCGGDVAFSSELISALTRHCYSTHVRELESLLWRSMQTSAGAVLECTSELEPLLRLPEAAGSPEVARSPDAISRLELRAALARHGGVKERVWRELGLSSRYALLRLIRKLEEQ